MNEDYSREGEPRAEQLDRNYGELLQELRVAQTGVQILFAFLLTIPFQQHFGKLSDYARTVYVVTLLLAAAATVLLIAPTVVHRVLFRQHKKDEIVVFGARLASAGLAVLALAMLSAILLTLTVAVGHIFAIVATAFVLVLFAITWLVIPFRLHQLHRPPR